MSNQPKHRIDRTEAWEKLEKAREILGDATIVEQISNYFDIDDHTWSVEQLDSDYELGLFDDDEEEGAEDD